MVNYNLGKIYKIVCNQTGLVYIGSCTTLLCSRIASHKQQLRKGRSCSSYRVLEHEDYYIILIEDFPCERREQLLARERYWIDNTECVNKQLPLRTKKEWYSDNKEQIIANQLIWNNENRDKLYGYQKKYKQKLANAVRQIAEEDNIQMHEIYVDGNSLDENNILH